MLWKPGARELEEKATAHGTTRSGRVSCLECALVGGGAEPSKREVRDHKQLSACPEGQAAKRIEGRETAATLAFPEGVWEQVG